MRNLSGKRIHVFARTTHRYLRFAIKGTGFIAPAQHSGENIFAQIRVAVSSTNSWLAFALQMRRDVR